MYLAVHQPTLHGARQCQLPDGQHQRASRHLSCPVALFKVMPLQRQVGQTLGYSGRWHAQHAR